MTKRIKYAASVRVDSKSVEPTNTSSIRYLTSISTVMVPSAYSWKLLKTRRVSVMVAWPGVNGSYPLVTLAS